jgi:predicted nucleotidyltransferase
MLKIINDLAPFFEDCYRRINVREYAKIIKISPPTASQLLSSYHKENLLSKEIYKNYILFYANKQSKQFIDLSRIYWNQKLLELIHHLQKNLTNPTIILFGSLSKAETKSDSDIDLAIFAHKKQLNLNSFEKKLKRKIQSFFFKSIKDIKNKELKNNILNGYLLRGRLSI